MNVEKTRYELKQFDLKISDLINKKADLIEKCDLNDIKDTEEVYLKGKGYHLEASYDRDNELTRITLTEFSINPEDTNEGLERYDLYVKGLI